MAMALVLSPNLVAVVDEGFIIGARYVEQLPELAVVGGEPARPRARVSEWRARLPETEDTDPRRAI